MARAGRHEGRHPRPTPVIYPMGIVTALAPSSGAFGLSWNAVGGGVSWLAAMAIAGSLAALWIVAVDRPPVLPLLTALVAGAFAPIFVIGFAVDAARVLAQRPAEVSASDVATTDEDFVAVRGAVVRTDLIGADLTDPPPGTPRRDYFVAPVVPEGWTSEMPVVVWLQCEGDGDEPRASCDPHFAQRPVTGLVFREAPSENLGVASALREHELTAPAEITVLRTRAEPGLDAAAALVAIGGLLTLVTGFALFGGYVRRSSEPARGTAEQRAS